MKPPGKTLSWFGLFLFAFVLLAAAPAHAAGVHVDLETPTLNLPAGTTFTVKRSELQADASFNAFDAYLQFDPSKLAHVSGLNQPDSLVTVAFEALGGFAVASVGQCLCCSRICVPVRVLDS